MTIASAITALSPSIWYRCDETSGTTATNQGTQVNDGTYSGSYTQGVPGPELNTYATRLFSGGQIISGAMDLTTFVGQSLGVWMSTDGSGTVNTPFPIVSIGDPTNRLSRGPAIQEQHSTVGIPFAGARWGGAAQGISALPAPPKFWHWVVSTFNTGTANWITYVDGVMVQTGTLSAPGALLATDPLLVRCDEPMIVAHVCWWGGILTQTQIQSVAAQLAPWPYTQPINLPPPTVSGGGGLTPDQATQLSDVHGWTADIPGLVSASNFISSTVNTINGIVTDIQTKVNQLTANLTAGINSVINAVSAEITTLTGTVTKSIGQLFSGFDPNNITSVSLGSACAGSVITANLGINFYYGVTMQCTSHAAWYVFTGPADDYTTQALGTLDITRGGNLVLRKGLHTLTDEIYPLPALPPIEQVINVGFTPGDYVVTLTPAPETCWTMHALRFTP